jgi:DNA-directed RNA polymerase subunit RPC12/RpoP
MPIETICQTCARKLRVADEFAGKKARCPQCGTIYIVPGQPEVTPEDGISETIYKRRPDDEKWQVRTPDNRVYGPVPKSELDQWVAEGRVPPEASLQSESSGYWRPAGDVFPQLRRSAPLQAATNPFADQPLESPFAAPAFLHGRPHRGVMILIFAILGWVACPVFAPIAWIMGQSDLREMRQGLMDNSGMSLTQAGVVLAMIETIFGLLFLALMCVGGLA